MPGKGLATAISNPVLRGGAAAEQSLIARIPKAATRAWTKWRHSDERTPCELQQAAELAELARVVREEYRRDIAMSGILGRIF
jgi:hypothetical protein